MCVYTIFCSSLASCGFLNEDDDASFLASRSCASESYNKYLQVHSGPLLIVYLRTRKEDFKLNSHSDTMVLFVSAESCDLYILSTDLTIEQATSSLGLRTQTWQTIIKTERQQLPGNNEKTLFYGMKTAKV